MSVDIYVALATLSAVGSLSECQGLLHPLQICPLVVFIDPRKNRWPKVANCPVIKLVLEFAILVLCFLSELVV